MILVFDINDVDMVSTNNMYLPRPCNHGKHAYLTKSTYLKKFQGLMEPLLDVKITKEQVDSIQREADEYGDDFAIRLWVKFYFTHGKYLREDTSNYIKALEDCITQRTGIDDRKHFELHLKKVEKEKDETLTARVWLETYRLSGEVDEYWIASSNGSTVS